MEQFGDVEFTTVKTGEGFNVREVCSVPKLGKITCCHFSSDGKFLASAGHDREVFIWNMETGHAETAPEVHDDIITDVRFRSHSTQLATSSFDKTIKIWEASKPGYYCLQTIAVHTAPVVSLDFHPRQTDWFCYCDSSSVMSSWIGDTDSCSCIHALEGKGCKQVRFDPQDGFYIAVATQKTLSVVDIETDDMVLSEEHDTSIQSNSWDSTGEFLASVTKDSVSIWKLDTGHKVCDLTSDGKNKFCSCVFHPSVPQLLIIGCYKSLELWNWVERKEVMSLQAHECLISALADSPSRGIIASASYDESIKIWK